MFSHHLAPELKYSAYMKDDIEREEGEREGERRGERG